MELVDASLNVVEPRVDEVVKVIIVENAGVAAVGPVDVVRRQLQVGRRHLAPRVERERKELVDVGVVAGIKPPE